MPAGRAKLFIGCFHLHNTSLMPEAFVGMLQKQTFCRPYYLYGTMSSLPSQPSPSKHRQDAVAHLLLSCRIRFQATNAPRQYNQFVAIYRMRSIQFLRALITVPYFYFVTSLFAAGLWANSLFTL